jgi:hypothetical protein
MIRTWDVIALRSTWRCARCGRDQAPQQAATLYEFRAGHWVVIGRYCPDCR